MGIRDELLSLSIGPCIKARREIEERRFKGLKPPLIMGILNVTPDSFSDGGDYIDPDKAIERGLEMVSEGADIIDVGGESTRPYAAPISLEEELSRVLPVVRGLCERTGLPVSIDTRHLEVARACLGLGASIVNDVGGLREEGMEELIASTGANAVVMHMKGTPGTMQVAPVYEDVVGEVRSFLLERVRSLEAKGVERGSIFIDPGIGFGKRVEDNLILIKELRSLTDIGCPVLVGASRKSFIGKVLGLEVKERLEGSISAAVVSVMNGASVLRVHDVLPTKRALALLSAIQDPKENN